MCSFETKKYNAGLQKGRVSFVPDFEQSTKPTPRRKDDPNKSKKKDFNKALNDGYNKGINEDKKNKKYQYEKGYKLGYREGRFKRKNCCDKHTYIFNVMYARFQKSDDYRKGFFCGLRKGYGLDVSQDSEEALTKSGPKTTETPKETLEKMPKEEKPLYDNIIEYDIASLKLLKKFMKYFIKKKKAII